MEFFLFRRTKITRRVNVQTSNGGLDCSSEVKHFTFFTTCHNSLNILPCHSAQANQPAVHERIQSSRMKSRHEFSQSKLAPKH